MLSVTGTSFAFVSVGLTVCLCDQWVDWSSHKLQYINNEYKADGTGMCRFAADGSKLPCPEVFGALLGTASVVSVMAIAMAFVPPRALRKVT